MYYLISFLEGVITFISPCLLPMLPVYISYFAGDVQQGDTHKAVRNALGFVLGFTLVFVALGALTGFMGGLLRQYQTVVNLITGGIVVLFGLNYLEILHITFLNRTRQGKVRIISGFFSAVLFGIVFSVGWTPCASAFLGSALTISAQQGSAVQGILMLLCYSIGLGLPFLLSAVLIEKLKTAFEFIKRHYAVVKTVSGMLLIAVGILIMTGMMDKFLALLTF